MFHSYERHRLGNLTHCTSPVQYTNCKLCRTFIFTQFRHSTILCCSSTLVQALRLRTGHTAHRGSRGITPLLLDHGTRRGWGVMPWLLFSPGKTRYPLYRRLGGPQGWFEQVWKKMPPPQFDPRTIHPIASCYTDYATQTTIRVGQCNKNVCFLSKRWTIIPTAFSHKNISLQQMSRMHKLFLSLLWHFTVPINIICELLARRRK